MKTTVYKGLTLLFGMLSVFFLVSIIMMLGQSEDSNENYVEVGETIVIGSENQAIDPIYDPRIVVLETNLGDIVIELDLENAPQTTQNFISYVDEGYYNGLVFHRVIGNFMVQGGGFYPNQTQKETRAPILLESDNGLSNTRGTIAMARTNNPNSATSQFFINVVDNNFLDYSAQNPGYAVFGKVIEGMEVVDAIREVQTETKGFYQDWPVEDVLIENAYLRGE